MSLDGDHVENSKCLWWRTICSIAHENAPCITLEAMDKFLCLMHELIHNCANSSASSGQNKYMQLFYRLYWLKTCC